MNIESDSLSIFNYHRGMIGMHGNKDSAALGWKDAQSQMVRFEILAQIADLSYHSVLDAGCGHGDLKTFLYDIYPGISYWGIEQIPELIKVAVDRYGHCMDTHFYTGNFLTDSLPVVDYVMASGSLNYRSHDPDFIFKAIKKIYDCCTMGVGFNLLSKIPENGIIVAYDALKIIDYCNTLSTKVILKRDYSDEDFTVFIYH
ncbi:class I SAM-dependent methyltransferase [Mucilaginibacter sp. SP1R1]|uniref:class I SAM-dependent methyltransferase n=1 Tax=Mucilaginibacter sp. SP1R1 TaxID=2723091 RepID=UPI001616EFCB|nr:class I SAM-dependent methyltransferase [Mucilaginibacter sp. SP1R1]MBB6151841.1 trans-aconitate methyltransferase [Mucilaginibacter sp. SP1R1]